MRSSLKVHYVSPYALSPPLHRVFNRVDFTQLAADYQAVNLGQGFPDFAPPKFLQESFCKAVSGGSLMHQYTRAFVSRFFILNSTLVF